MVVKWKICVLQKRLEQQLQHDNQQRRQLFKRLYLNLKTFQEQKKRNCFCGLIDWSNENVGWYIPCWKISWNVLYMIQVTSYSWSLCELICCILSKKKKILKDHSKIFFCYGVSEIFSEHRFFHVCISLLCLKIYLV